MSFHILCEEEVPALQREGIERAMEGFVQADLPLAAELIFVDEEEIRRLNRETRDTDRVTDVLSYPTLDGIKGKPLYGADYPFDVDEGRLLVGSIAVCIQRAKEQANEYGHSLERELNYLIVHGILHCLGYDHIADGERAEMREKEEDILGKMGIVRE